MSMSHSRLSAPQLRATAVATVLDSKRTGLLSGEIAADLAELWVKQILGASDVQRRAISFACDDFINRYVVANQQAHVVDALAGGLAPADASIEDGEIRQSSVQRTN